MIQQTDAKATLRRYVAAVQAGDETVLRGLFQVAFSGPIRATNALGGGL